MIPTDYEITLWISGSYWGWTVAPRDRSDDESGHDTGRASDFFDACRAAHAAHDRLVAESGESK